MTAVLYEFYIDTQHYLKGVLKMIAEPSIFSGNECTIIRLYENTESCNDNNICINTLISECSSSKKSLSILYDMFKKSVFSIAFSITSDYQLSEDCVIETFVRLTQVKGFNPNKGDGKGYIHTIARNVALEMRRKHTRDQEELFIQNYGEADKIVEDSIFLNQLLTSLNEKQRQIVVMKICNEMTFKEIAKIMKRPESTIKSRYKKAISILKHKAGVEIE